MYKQRRSNTKSPSPKKTNKASTPKRSMFTHVLVHLKTRPTQKVADIQKMRSSVVNDITTKSPGFSRIIETEHPSTIACELSSPVQTPKQLSANITDLFSSHRSIETFAAAMVVKPNPPELSTENMNDEDIEPVQPIGNDSLTDSVKTVSPKASRKPVPTQYIKKGPIPTVDDAMRVFDTFVKVFDTKEYEAYNLRCIVSRDVSKVYRHYGEEVRDKVSEYMALHNQMVNERSPEMKMKLTQLREQAEKHAKETNTAYVRPTLNSLLLNLDVKNDIGFWYNEPLQGGGHTKSRAEVFKDKKQQTQQNTIEERVGQRVIICKIGEIFLKKGNRAKFIMQLYQNIVLKLQGKAHVTRLQYSFVIRPMFKRDGDDSSIDKKVEFTDEEIKTVTDILKCIPGIESIHTALQTSPDEKALATSLHYALGVAALTPKHSCKVKTLSPSLLSIDAKVRDTVLQYLKGSLMPEQNRTPQQAEELSLHVPLEQNRFKNKRRTQRLSKYIVDVINLGYRIDIGLSQPCFYTSKTKLSHTLQDMIRVETTQLGALTEVVKNPGQYAQYLRQLEALNKQSDPFASDYEDEEETLEKLNKKLAAKDGTGDGELPSDDGSEDVGETSLWIRPTSGADVKVDVMEHHAYIYFSNDTIMGVGGQPTGTGQETQTVVCLLSGGMDSPVAAFSLMKRGLRVILVHFQNANLADEETVQNKIIQIADHLSRYQMTTYLHIVPFSAIQDAIITEVPGPARMLVYRRFMFSIAAEVAKTYNAKFLVLGDALGQVASQTASNMYASYTNTELPLLSPLVGHNKSEIMDIARRIGTYDISALPYGDCCSYFLAKHPLTRIDKELLHRYEANVGRALKGGNKQLINDAKDAAAVYRWYRPDEGMITLRQMSSVQSHHDNAATELLMSCPIYRGEEDKEEDIEHEMDETGNIKVVKKNSGTKMGDDALDLDEEAMILGKPSNENPTHKRSLKRTDDDDMAATNTSLASPESNDAASPIAPHAEGDDTLPTTNQTKKLRPSSNSTPDQSDIVTISPTPADDATPVIAYLDSAATTRVLPVVINAVQRFASGQLYGNASSTHLLGRTADLAVKQTTKILCQLINAHPLDHHDEQQLQLGLLTDTRMVYTSGGTESNNLAIFGSLKTSIQQQIDNIVTSLGETPVSTASHGLTTQSNSNPTGHQPVCLQHHQDRYVLGVHILTSQLEHNAILEPIEFLSKFPDTLISQAYGLNIHVHVHVNVISNDNHGVLQTSHLPSLLSMEPHLNPVNIKKNIGLDVSATSQPVHIINAATFVSVMHGNNEISVIQPLEVIGNHVHEYRQQKQQKALLQGNNVPPHVLFHSDACQSFGKVHIDVQHAKIDLLSLNGHKLHGMKGIGSLYINPQRKLKLSPLQWGGKHQNNIRSGTLNIPGIVSMQTAAVYACELPSNINHDDIQKYLLAQQQQQPSTSTPTTVHNTLTRHGKKLRQLQYKFIYKLLEIFPHAMLNGPVATVFSDDSKPSMDDIDDFSSHIYTSPQSSIPTVISIILNNNSKIDSSGIVKYLNVRGVCVSAGSACASNNAEPKPSHVLKGINLRDESANNTIRISLGLLTTQKELDDSLGVFKQLASDMKTMYKP